jgi:acetylornithine deacetylase
MSTYPDRCVLKVERRMLPGESGEDALAEVGAACARIAARRSDFRTDTRLLLAQPASDVDTEAPVVLALSRALRDQGEPVRIEGMSAWTDAALLNAAGIPAICFGPGDIALAHAAEEWIAESEIQRATGVLERMIRDWAKG